MSHSCVIRKSKPLTDAAKKLFGDIVKIAYYCEPYYKHLGMLNAIERLDKQESSATYADDSIDQDSKTIVIEFVNGNTIVFYNSEWGSMDKLKPEEVVVL